MQPASPSSPSDQIVTPLAHLAVLQVSGQAATAFLQGQCTCDLHALTAQNAGLGALCNAKGRVITTFIILKHDQSWLLILPTELLPLTQKTLQRYILRAKVQLTDCSHSHKIFGLIGGQPLPTALPAKHLATYNDWPAQAVICWAWRQPRYLWITDAQQQTPDWLHQGYTLQPSAVWQRLDMEAGIPWLDAHTSEAFIPQMLNLDQLGGISFSKGCYTGQEVVARTHYLGQAKRALYTATAEFAGAAPSSNSAILDAPGGQSVGNVLAAQLENGHCTLLLVLATEACALATLTLQEAPHATLKVLPSAAA